MKRMTNDWTDGPESIDISEMRFEDVEEAKRVAAGLTAQVAAAFGDSTGYTAFWDCRGYWTLARVSTCSATTAPRNSADPYSSETPESEIAEKGSQHD